MKSDNDINSILTKLYSMRQFHIKLGLERIEKFLQTLDNPHKKLKVFHIAGSNGKGSTASFIASILMAAGYKTGLYTSPHFVRFNERVQINGNLIEDEFIASFYNKYEKYIIENEITFFEATTAMAFDYFARKDIDYAVIETGLGGRLDATNLVDPLASVITSISLEHTHILGDTVEKIAREKGGIIKEGRPVFVGNVDGAAAEVINGIAKEKKSSIFFLNNFAEKEKDFVNLTLKNQQFHIYKTPLIGYHQLINCALALKTLNETLNINDGLVIDSGIEKVIENTNIQGRYEVISESPKVIFDAAHNPEGIDTFLREFKNEAGNYEKRSVIFAAMKDKEIPDMIKKLGKTFDTLYVTSVGFERSATIEELKNAAERAGINAIPLYEPVELIKDFIMNKKNECLAVLGSIYLLGKLKSKIYQFT
ncbi:FolC bifunctional protein [Melioribacter roseus P3M-2]|uniref:Dihydrofolate synthase/folylpolyglutamate synthase n=1 Tax=Melioribacter roseus (strain DSM 23840 / JCM 17771 / VKM B-2668 / P3M-2) TaxID=1191523 RepID=I6YRT5_MELRP|nr:folylpolyglutamate synthase/dihydrofolate synthase family protein [Melioribacter roseus]AFN73257.1 FolC bifunctional protein [Melioribacter roseus P3M-2]